MLIIMVMSAISALLSFAAMVLPSATFLPMPNGVETAFEYLADGMRWLVSLGGPTLAPAFVTCAKLWVSVSLTLFVIDVIRFWSVPILNRTGR